ncbi:rhodanese-like domain-containing protein [Salimicrobium halophilum]|uniref:Rhodanese-related sulfurtransferase n=1 Tax=Salimicrobium halophilum TaxID=86666 RepID=A0A1G8SYL9_9BACI|nr:rhodanese-like domain-containing protein [Salimicrobium halophilum]SDJ34254.1 Rhodanese-related sulfurtransferase [Salimicrobium halophilum]
MKTIQAKEVETRYNDLNVVDVREAEEVAEGKIPGATHIPLGVLEYRMNELDKNTPYVMVCRSGGRSSQATRFLQDQGYDVTNMEGGMMSYNGDTEK